MKNIETIYIRKNDKYIAIQPAIDEDADDGSIEPYRIFLVKGDRKSDDKGSIFISSDKLHDLLVNNWAGLEEGNGQD